MRNKKKIIIYSILFLGILGGIFLYYILFSPQFFPTRKTNIYIDRDDNMDSVYNKIKCKGNVRCFQGFKWMAIYKNMQKHIHTGCYTIHPKDNVFQLFIRIHRGHQTPVNLTLRSVRTLDKIAQSVSRQLMIDSTEIASLLNDTTYQKELGFNQATIPCLFIANTYQVYWNISAQEFFERMKKEYNRYWNKERLDKATSIGLSAEEICTLASIVEEETNKQIEKPIIAGLYINRLKLGMPLQADPTISYALQKLGMIQRISQADLQVESPYNTYIHKGLPPGPIRTPSQQGLESVLNHAKHNYIYMCAKEDFSGTHNFAANYGEHLKNAQKYWAALNRRKIGF